MMFVVSALLSMTSLFYTRYTVLAIPVPVCMSFLQCTPMDTGRTTPLWVVARFL